MTKKMLQFALSIFLFSTSITCTTPTYRFWIVNTNVTIGSRYWDSLVTVGSFTFNGSMTHAVAIPSVKNKVDECELIYPLDKLPASVSSDLYNTTEQRKCDDEKLLSKMERVYWLDPRNWVSIHHWSSPFSYSEAVPHTERVPCNYDRIRIPNTTSTFIIMPPNPIIVSEFAFGYKTMYKVAWKKYSKDEYLMRHFIAKSTNDLYDMINITYTDSCGSRTGCQCGNKIYEEEICAFVSDDCAKDLPCVGPIKPFGHCCLICGAAVMFTFDDNTFVYKKLERVIEKFVKSQTDQMKYEVNAHMSKVSEYLVQIVLLPKEEYSNDLLDLANGLNLYLEKASYLGIESSFVSQAGKPKASQEGWSTIAIIFAGLAIALIAGIVLVYANKLKWFEGAISFFNGMNSSKFTEDKNQQNRSMEPTKEEVNDTQTEKVTESESTIVQHENQPHSIDASDKLI